MSSLSMHTRREAERTVIALEGELDLATVPELRDKAVAALDDPSCSTLALDLTDLEFVDSTGLGCWIELRNKAEQTGKALVLEAVPAATRRTLTISGLAGLFGVA